MKMQIVIEKVRSSDGSYMKKLQRDIAIRTEKRHFH